MAKRRYTALQEEVNVLLTKDDERTRKELDALEIKLDHILSNQSEILTRLGVVAQGRYGLDVCEVDVAYFPVSDPDELPKLDAYLAEPGNPYGRLMRRLLRPDGKVTPLKKSFVKLFTDNILLSFNYAGVSNKKAFNQYKNINKTLLDIQKSSGYILSDYITEIRAAFHAAKRRCHKRNHDQRRRSQLSQEAEAENEWD
ncbi:uncharacterized protein [Drosophila kikkawai]|uniref:DUF4806 domain-containing protein n=1 Tax=Drosophila kikkawai TaxID=30033 RepID=A0A6P4IA04_DROKI|nr:uncharacterized protein LOC108076611 [Drosophila kikkawai]